MIKRELKNRIARKDYTGTIPVPPEKDLAVEFQAAPMTVRRAIQELVDEGVLVRLRGRGKGTFVREIRGVPFAAQSASAKLKRMGILHRQSMEQLRDSAVYFMIFMEVQAECSRNGIALEFLPTPDGASYGAKAIKRIAKESKIQALIVLDWWESDDLIEVQRSGLHVIVPGPFQETTPVSFVGPNEYQGAFAATRHLMDLGHEKVAMVNSRKEVRTTTDRWAGWLAATGLTAEEAQKRLYRAGRIDPHAGQSFDEVCNGLTADFKKRKPPSAIFARDGLFAFATITALARLGYKCPDDISVACMGGYYERSLGLPKMTAAKADDGALGRNVIRLAQDLVSGRQEGPVGILLPMQVIEGESAKPLKK